MIDREKVINVLQDAVNDDWMWQHADCYAKAMENALTLLKEQEPVDMVPEGGGPSWWLVCTECHGAVDSSDKFCRHCGRPFKQQKKSKCDGCVYKGGEDCPQSLEIRGDVFCPNGKLG